MNSKDKALCFAAGVAALVPACYIVTEKPADSAPPPVATSAAPVVTSPPLATVTATATTTATAVPTVAPTVTAVPTATPTAVPTTTASVDPTIPKAGAVIGAPKKPGAQ